MIYNLVDNNKNLLGDYSSKLALKIDESILTYRITDELAITNDILRRLKADKKTREFVKFLVREHMVDLDLKMKEKKIRRYIVKNHKRFSSLMDIKQADFRASLEKHEIAPTVLKWQGIYCKMNLDGTPFSLKDLKISAQDLLELNFKEKEIGKELEKLFELAVENPEKNNYQALIKIAEKDAKKLIN